MEPNRTPVLDDVFTVADALTVSARLRLTALLAVPGCAPAILPRQLASAPLPADPAPGRLFGLRSRPAFIGLRWHPWRRVASMPSSRRSRTAIPALRPDARRPGCVVSSRNT